MPYEIYAIKYGDHQRLASGYFLGGDPHNGPMPIDYFVCAIKGAQRTWVVDTGPQRRERPLARPQFSALPERRAKGART